MPPEKTALDLLADPWKSLLEKELTTLEWERAAAKGLIGEQIVKRAAYATRENQLREPGQESYSEEALGSAKGWFNDQIDKLTKRVTELDHKLEDRRKEADGQTAVIAEWDKDIDAVLTELATLPDAVKQAQANLDRITTDREQARKQNLTIRVEKLDRDLARAESEKNAIPKPDEVRTKLARAYEGWTQAYDGLVKISISSKEAAAGRDPIESLDLEKRKLARQIDYLRKQEADITRAYLRAQRAAATQTKAS